MKNLSPTLVVLPEADLEAIRSTLAQVGKHLDGLANRPTPPPTKDWLTRQEAMHLLGIKSTKFHQLNQSGKLKTRYKGRRLYIHHSSIEDYFSGR